MGTHPIFESDFDCLTEKKMVRMSLARSAYSNANRLGYLGYGHKIKAEEVVPLDNRNFRDLKLYEVTGWIGNQDVSPNGLLMAVRRRWVAWRWKYASPVEIKAVAADKVCNYGGADRYAPTGSGLAQMYLIIFLAFYFYTYDEAVHHRHRKYHW